MSAMAECETSRALHHCSQTWSLVRRVWQSERGGSLEGCGDWSAGSSPHVPLLVLASCSS